MMANVATAFACRYRLKLAMLSTKVFRRDNAHSVSDLPRSCQHNAVWAFHLCCAVDNLASTWQWAPLLLELSVSEVLLSKGVQC